MIDETRNVSTIEITLTREAKAKRRDEGNAGNPRHTTEATKELV
jgi:hypothetical protein